MSDGVESLVCEPLPEVTQSEGVADGLNKSSELVKDAGSGNGNSGPAVSPAPSKSTIDEHGQSFDSAIHWTNPKTGKGQIVKKTGKWRTKPGPGRGHRPEQKKPSGSVIGEMPGEQAAREQAAQAEQALIVEKARAVAVVTVGTMTQVCRAVFDPNEWRASEQETAMMVEAWANYYRLNGVTQLPPWMEILVATSAYALPRLPQPKTLSKLDKIKLGLARLRDKWRARKSGKRERQDREPEKKPEPQVVNDPFAVAE